jgi:dolichol-phosphate mannosyltransferase
MEQITIIVPVKDEEVGLEYLLEDFHQSNISEFFDVRFIFVIDIRTSDSSKKIASKFSDNIIDQSNTTGKGAAVKQAVSFWKLEPTPKVIFLDADGSYSFNSVKKILQALEDGADVVSGSRFLSEKNGPEGMSRLHNFGNKALSIFSSIRNLRKISDLCTGLWGFKKEALQNFSITSNGFDLEAEIVGLVRKNNLKHLEVEVEWSQRKGGTSKLRSLTDGLIIFFRILRT